MRSVSNNSGIRIRWDEDKPCNWNQRGWLPSEGWKLQFHACANKFGAETVSHLLNDNDRQLSLIAKLKISKRKCPLMQEGEIIRTRNRGKCNPVAIKCRLYLLQYRQALLKNKSIEWRLGFMCYLAPCSNNPCKVASSEIARFLKEWLDCHITVGFFHCITANS